MSEKKQSTFVRQSDGTANVAQNFVRALQQEDTMDSVAGAEIVAGSGYQAAAKLAEALPAVKRGSGEFTGGQVVAQAVLDGVQEFERRNGFSPNGGVIHTALQSAFGLFGADQAAVIQGSGLASFDSAAVLAGASTGSMVTNAAQLAIFTSIASAIPFGGYVPMDKGMSGKLIIGGHRAGSKTGSYDVGSRLNGVDGGKVFMSNLRTVKAESGDQTTFNATVKYADGDSAGCRIVPNTAKVFVNGLIACQAAVNIDRASTRDLRLAGGTTLKVSGANKEYGITATINIETGVATITASPALPAGSEVHFEAGVDYENAAMKDKRPVVEAYASAYDIVAHTHSGIYRVTAEADTQWRVELGQSYEMQATLALRNQSSNERHFKAVHDMYRIGKGRKYEYDLKADSRLGDRSRSSLFEDAFITIAQADQDMVEATGEFGIGVLYVGSKGKAYLSSLPEPTFIPSGIRGGAGIHRFGTLKGIPVYYIPKTLTESADGFEMLAIGRSDQIGFNPYIIGDVTGAVIERVPQAFDLTKGATYFHSMVNQVNPNQQIASAAAVITFKNPH